MKKEKQKRIFAALLAALLITLAVWSGLFDTIAYALSDALYQRQVATDGEIVVIGMDQRAVDEFGPMPWPRDIMADAIAYLNQDPENAPAVIGVDVLYVGESGDEWADEYLAEMVSEGGNVVLAAAATFGTKVVSQGDSFSMDTMAVTAWDKPYDALASAAKTGHINAMADMDGVLRHALLYVDAPEGRVKSMARTIYEMYAAAKGIAANPEPKTNARAFFYLPYTAKPNTYYDGVSVAALVYGEIDPSYFAGKIVLIGPYAAGMQDEYRTAIDHASPMYGIEIQANQIEAFRTGRIPIEPEKGIQLALLFVVTAVLFLLLENRSVIVMTVISLAAALIWVGACLLAFRKGFVLSPLGILLAIIASYVVQVALNYIRASREKRHITETFGRYVDPAVLPELLKQEGTEEALKGKLYDVAVLFVDIRGFTSMSEALSPEEVVDILNRYLTLTTKCIMQNHGTLDKFVGDCTMAFWNAPLPQDDPVYLACRAAMDMAEGAKALGEELIEKYGRSVSFGVGVHFGPAVIGNIGAPQRMDYTAIGDTVNTAARLESNAPAGKVFISRIVADMLGERAMVTSLGDSIRLKGKQEGFECLTLDTLK